MRHGLAFKHQNKLWLAEYLDELGNISGDADIISDESKYYENWNRMSFDLVEIQEYQQDVINHLTCS